MISTGQALAGTAPLTLLLVPPGPASVLLVNAGTVTAYYAVGTATTVSTANGVPLPSGAAQTITAYQGDGGIPLSVVTDSGTAVTIGFVVSTAAGGTGL